MKNTIATITIGIPAHNEGQNIARLLENLSEQNQTNFVIEKILVVADGCSDDTVSKVRSIDWPVIEVIESTKRQGKSLALNYITSHTKTDLLLLLDADVQLKTRHFVEKLIAPIVNGDVALTSARVVPKKGSDFFTKILYLSNQYKQNLYEAWNGGDNIYTCHGRALCMNKKLYSHIEYTGIIADDAYAYIMAKKLHLSYSFAGSAELLYRLPQTLLDHRKQSSRFLQSQQQLNDLFKNKSVAKMYKIPLDILLKETSTFLVRQPVSMVLYIFLFIYLKVESMTKRDNLIIWDVARTSKI